MRPQTLRAGLLAAALPVTPWVGRAAEMVTTAELSQALGAGVLRGQFARPADSVRQTADDSGTSDHGAT